MLSPRPPRQAGQTMVELLVAGGIITTSVLSTLGLVLATTRSSAVSKTGILASNFAREGVEIVRSIRDGNWLKIDSGLIASSSWNQNLASGTDYSAIPHFNPVAGTWQLRFSGVGVGSLGASPTLVYRHPTSGLYSQWENPATVAANLPGFQGTQYWRVIRLQPICWNLSVAQPENTESMASQGSTCPAPKIQVGVEVVSYVRWKEHGQIKNVQVVDKLFNWKT